MKKTKIKLNKPVYLGMYRSNVSKTLMYEIWCDYIKPKHRYKAKLCYMGNESFVIHIFTEDFFEDIGNDVKILFHTSKYDKNNKKPLRIGMNKNVIGLFKYQLRKKL